ncbi:DUF3823 domain-containing protein [Parabacteroides sp. PF5-9]|uniref:DUF3823 domain-containing protein n=1 Tax=Parabacteroides sp. PF5-9 TaxID=1742404 RepID=UPI0024758B35|nr:DUF3823 domain-containing protein [Parabacteroides sp. PF5-9]MDH6356214.1 hypothetical protein [Parabacteroides sp. PF5-9]
MKRVIHICWLIPCLLLAFVSCEIDNYDGPNASFSGQIKDAATGEPVGTDIQNGSVMQVYELGWETPTAQTWVIKQTGEFQNDMVFAARYDLVFENCNFYPFKMENFEIKKGKNTHDFEVTPYIRIKNPNIIHDATNKRIIATFSLEGGKPEVLLSAIRLYAFTDMYVGEQVKFSTKGENFSRNFSPAQTIDGTTYTLSIDLEENADQFKYSRNYYFRIGALSSVPNVGTIRHNYSPLVVIAL